MIQFLPPPILTRKVLLLNVILKLKEKRPLTRPRCRWEDINIHLREIVCEEEQWIKLA
jgi:hypothetical protein